jgi:hypothetical protein
MKRFIAFLALAALVAPAANADPVEGATATVLAVSDVTEFTADGNCVIWRGDGDVPAATCSTDLTTELTFPTDVFITKFGTVLFLAGDAGFECDFQIKVNGTAAGTAIDQATSTTIGAANLSVSQDLLVPAGQEVEVVVTAGTGGCNQTTTDPKYVVVVYGYPVN